MKTLTITFSQTIQLGVQSNDTIETCLDKIKKEIDHLLYSGNKYLEFVIDDCPEMPELVDEMID